ncbi:Ribonuclease 3 [Colletotrichum spinosum]|uniref:Ribonuclease 3 n=1 Tax=Colletotrichum spinosum TaxID=1347390 RepID=A0A4R8PXV8_9PEZI|nr:Ribonuclease 3 [Colletotrichum spinosum]
MNSRVNLVEDASVILHYRFENPNWLWEALQAAGSPALIIGGRRIREGNKQLAGLGNRVLNLVIVKNAFENSLSIGDTNREIQQHANNDRLAILCDVIGLTRCINRNASQQGGVSPKTKTATIEAIIGAVYKDGDLEAAEEVIKSMGIV